MLTTMIQPGLVRSVVATLSMTHRLNSCGSPSTTVGNPAARLRSILQVGAQHVENRGGHFLRLRLKETGGREGRVLEFPMRAPRAAIQPLESDIRSPLPGG